MAKGRTSKAYSPPKLVVPREEASRRIRERIGTGREIKDQKMFSMADLESAQERRTKWLEDNIEMLTRLFNNPFFKEEYDMSFSLDMDSAITFSLKEKYFKDDMNEQIGRLESLLERLKLIPEMKAGELIEEPMRKEQPKEMQPREAHPREVQTRELKSRKEVPKEEPLIEEPLMEEISGELTSMEKGPKKEMPDRGEILREEPPSTTVLNQSQLGGGNILLVHGRDEATKESVLKFLEKMGLQALILHEQPDGGKGLIEKFGESSNISFAIILITPDDIAAPRNKPKERQARASQNVMFELGYFWGKLGHGRVCVLYKEGVEMPSDYPGLMYIPMDSGGGWRLLAAKEIKQAGIEIDLNKAI